MRDFIENYALPILIFIAFAVVFGVAGYKLADLKTNDKLTQTIFNEDKEGTRFYYEGNVFLGANDNGFYIIFEDLIK